MASADTQASTSPIPERHRSGGNRRVARVARLRAGAARARAREAAARRARRRPRSATGSSCRSRRPRRTSTRSRAASSPRTRATASSSGGSRATSAGTRWRWSPAPTATRRRRAGTSARSPRAPRCTRSRTTTSSAAAAKTATRGDQVYFQGHAAPGHVRPGVPRRRLTEQNLVNFRREMGEGGGLSQLPAPVADARASGSSPPSRWASRRSWRSTRPGSTST